jgi:23S rRNA (guanosine2251-2'-O)-methyltransferase
VVPGERAVTELLAAAPGRVQRLLVEDGREFTQLADQANRLGLRVEHGSRQELDRLAGPGLARGVLAVAESPVLGDLDDLLDAVEAGHRAMPSGRRVLVALDGVQDPQNLGAIIRSAEFFGASGVFWGRDRSAPLSPSAVRASAGASERFPLTIVTNLARALERCRSGDWWVVGTVVDGGEPLVGAGGRSGLPDQVVLVMGSEERGIRRLTRERCDFLVSIEGGGGVGSLNVASAGAVALALLAARA